MVLRNALWLAGGEVWTKAGLFVLALLVARRLGAEALGIFQVASGAAQVAVTILVFGQIEPLVRETAKRPGLARALLGAARAVQVRLALWLAPVAVAGGLLVGEPRLRRALLAFFVWSLLRTAGMTWSSMYRGLDRMHEEVLARALEVATDLALVLALTALGAPVWTVGLAMAGGAAVGLLRLELRARGLPVAAAAGDHVGFLAREGISFLGIAVLFQLMLKLDTFVMAALGVEPGEIGIYAAAVIPTWGLLALPQLLAFSLLPTWSRGEASRRRRLAAAATATAVGIGAGGAAGLALWLLREPIVARLFGPGYSGATDLLALLAVALPGAALAMVLDAILAAWGRQRLALATKAGAVLVALALDLAWIPAHGLAGAARAAVVAHGGEAALLVALVLGCALRTVPSPRG